MRRFLLLAIACAALGLNDLQGQDPRYAQFYANPLQMNPALIGVFQGQFRAIANYRELYTSVLANRPFRTMSASFDMRHKVFRGDYLGWGLSAKRDVVGDSRFNRYKAHGGISYLKRVGGQQSYRKSTVHYLVAGAQAGIGQRGFDWETLWFTEQFDENTASVDFGSDNGEGFTPRSSDVYLDINAGLMYYAVFKHNASVYAGASMHHLNEPVISLLEENDAVLHVRWVGQAGGEVPFSEELSLLPAVAFMYQNTSTSITAGGNFRYTTREWKEVALRLGAWAHLANKLDSEIHADAVTIAAILELERVQIGLSYDVSTSSITAANNARGAFEISLIYVQPEVGRVKTVCPKF